MPCTTDFAQRGFTMVFRSLNKKLWLLVGSSLAAFTLVPIAAEEGGGRQIEEVIVTAERQEASIQDTSISITAFTGQMLEDFGIRNQSDLQNMIPATTIQPYDAAIRGVGRNFRNLGGDPGIATYMNGIYSEDLYTATIGSFWDIDRIEVLRGPQGTLYGRNAVGGAMNFLYKKPNPEWESTVKAVVGDYDTRDFYGVLSGPLIEDKLNFRLTGSSRKHDGWVDERSGLGPDLDSGDERNISGQFEWFITDNMSLHVRANKATVDRVFGGGNGGGLIVLRGENSEPGGNGFRNYTRRDFQLRNVDPAQTNPLAGDFVDPTQAILNYTNPTTGANIQAQYGRYGIDDGTSRGNQGFGQTLDPTECLFLDRSNIKGKDLCAFTNGLNNETFDQQGNQVDFTWELSETMTVKYLFGYNELLYKRDTDDDSNGSLLDDRTFFVDHEAEYVSHELQLFWDVADNLTFTTGVFAYDSTIDQRYDFYNAAGGGPRTPNADYAFDAIGAGLGLPPLTFLVGTSPARLKSAEENHALQGLGDFEIAQSVGNWDGQDLGNLSHGPNTPNTELNSYNKTQRKAYAAYTQGVWDINETFTLTAGVRWAQDKTKGEEGYSQFTHTMGVLDAFGISLGLANIIRGAIDPTTLQPTGVVEPWIDGTPITFGLYRRVQRNDKKVTWRVNLDWNINDDSLIYLNATTGYRSGGFNLAFFSQTPQYEPEELIAYEIGYKAQFFDNSLQLNASAYLYDYDSIHTFTEEACPPGGTLQSAQSACAVVDSTASVQAAPGAQIKGLEAEVLWLATERVTLGGNFSYTDAKYTKSFFVVDGADPDIPGGIYTSVNNVDRRRDVKGNRLQQVPETKLSIFSSYNLPLGNAGEVDFLVNYSHIGDVYFSAFETDLDLAPSYERVDFRATWTSPSQQWTVSGFLNNAFDEIGIRQILRGGVGDGYRRSAQVTEPRVVGMELSYSFR